VAREDIVSRASSEGDKGICLCNMSEPGGMLHPLRSTVAVMKNIDCSCRDHLRMSLSCQGVVAAACLEEEEELLYAIALLSLLATM
jgi:hypothetical protein